MTNIKTLCITIAILFGLLIITNVWNFYENSRPFKAKIDEAIKNYDDRFSGTVTTQFHNDNLFAFYETSVNTLKVVLLESNAVERVKVEALLGEMPMHAERAVSWHGIGNGDPGDTDLFYGVIFDPEISQLILESEVGEMAHIFKIDEDRSVWYRFLDNKLSTPVVITGTDKKGEEKFYYGPYRGEQ